jgi:flagellar biogenesis protein FliO
MTPWKIFLRTSLLCSIVGVVLFGLSLRRIESFPLSNAPLQFDAKKAHYYMHYLSKNFKNRVTWSDSRKKAASWIKRELAQMGYIPLGLRFSEVIAGKQYTDLENIYVIKEGKKNPNEIVVFMAHYDITDTTVEGAMDDASGVGVVMELARQFSKIDTNRTFLFLLTDSEEFGAFWGARTFAKHFERVDQIVAATSFDFVAPEKQTKVLTLCDGLKKGFTPLWLRELALDSVRSLGTVEATDMVNAMEFVLRAIQIPPADHAVFLAADIPAFNWVGQTDNFAYQMAHYHHTKHDVAEAIQSESMDDFGKAAERLGHSIDALPKIPEDFRNSSYWKVSSSLYVDGWAVTLLHILAFIPFLVYGLSRFGSIWKLHDRKKVTKVLLNEAKGIGILLGSFLLGYVLILMLPTLNLITQYEVFPATQKSNILFQPNFLVMALVVALVFFVYWLLQRTFAEPEDRLSYLEVRHSLHAVFLTLIIFLAFLKNSYLAVLLLLPPAYLWMFIRARQKTEDRILNGLFLVGGAITFVIMSLLMATIFHIGPVYCIFFCQQPTV